MRICTDKVFPQYGIVFICTGNVPPNLMLPQWRTKATMVQQFHWSSGENWHTVIAPWALANSRRSSNSLLPSSTVLPYGGVNVREWSVAWINMVGVLQSTVHSTMIIQQWSFYYLQYQEFITSMQRAHVVHSLPVLSKYMNRIMNQWPLLMNLSFE